VYARGAINPMSWFWKLEDRGFIALTTLFIAVLSLAVAAASLYFGISAQSTDREYKEISIRPRLQLEWDPRDFSVKIRNLGLGPAVINRVDIATPDHCSIITSEDQFQELNDRFYEMMIRFLDPILVSGGYTYEERAHQAHIGAMLLPGGTINNGQSHIVLQINPNLANDLTARLSKNRRSVDEAINREILKFQLSMQYCSITGRWCSNRKSVC
jgi:hypothetical protein